MKNNKIKDLYSKIFLYVRGVMEQKEFHLMVDMLKTAIKQEREFTKDELKKFDDLFEKIIDVKVT
ncbi:hypothetical protein NZNM25_07030 [Nitrosopumilus zosterae]|uniref:Uncharacterized protein n=1 Tax=Nitrosopumilus zosterae TaxID=718286 RepID=A0A2S2KQG2_9ARCH|nr:hypothetical protein [Nitrosopumilus zosterae]BDQ31700.1 hypothetical protein NZOSNM25_001832 [Nitrosopumilus zosterae]GBH33912.1 hypothetical protein NZNM25_07030 [Nitrosopumilus zosterae]